MKRNTRILIAAMAAVGIIGGGSAHAFRGDGNCGPQAMERSPGKFAGNRLQKLHDDLKLAPTEYDKWTGAMSTLLDMKNYKWIQSATVKESIFTRVKEIETIKRDYLNEKGMAE